MTRPDPDKRSRPGKTLTTRRRLCFPSTLMQEAGTRLRARPAPTRSELCRR